MARTTKNRHERINKAAHTLMGQLKIRVGDYRTCSDKPLIALELIRRQHEHIFGWVDGLSDAKKGELACCGEGVMPVTQQWSSMDNLSLRGAWSKVRREHWLDDMMVGYWLVTQIATTALVAAMTDIIWAELEQHRPRGRNFKHMHPFRT